MQKNRPILMQDSALNQNHIGNLTITYKKINIYIKKSTLSSSVSFLFDLKNVFI